VSAVAPAEADVSARAVARASRRLLPFLFVLYVVAYLDRINVSFAALQMRRDLGFDAAVYGLGAGIFFVGYFLFEVPSNLILARVGARRWIARILFSWGTVSVATTLVRDVPTFYALRFLLGVAEAGFFPGVILYLGYWFPSAERARAIARFMTATAVAGVVGGPLSGALLGLDGAAGLAGWRWLFLVEGVPAVALGVVVLVWLPDGPADAAWLEPAERAALVARLGVDHAATPEHAATTRAALADRRVWFLGLLYFVLVNGIYGVSLWLPQIVERLAGAGDLVVGVLSAVPYAVAAVGMVIVGAHSDRTGERRRHVAACALVGAGGLGAAALVAEPVASLAALSCGALGIWSAMGPFWAMPARVLRASGAAAGIALVNSLGNLGGFVGPWAVGRLTEATGEFAAGLVVLAGALVVAALLAAVAPEPR
jgi:ACS family tartrate transporter-like MFS transporter